jgi:hypothetical protein
VGILKVQSRADKKLSCPHGRQFPEWLFFESRRPPWWDTWPSSSVATSPFSRLFMMFGYIEQLHICLDRLRGRHWTVQGIRGIKMQSGPDKPGRSLACAWAKKLLARSSRDRPGPAQSQFSPSTKNQQPPLRCNFQLNSRPMT